MAPFRAALVLAILAAAPLMACSNQAEGERCDRNNNNEDCQEGLLCKSSAELGGSADICCPEAGSEVAACVPGGGGTSSSATGTGATTTGSAVTSTGTGTGGSGGGGSGSGGGASGSGGSGGGTGGTGGA